MILRRFSFWLLSLTLAACQNPAVRPTAPAPTVSADAAPRWVLTPKPQPYARIEPLATVAPGKRNLRLSFTYPLTDRGFRTQAFACGEVAAASVEVYGGPLTSPIYADGSDATTHRFAAGSCGIGATLSNVPYGHLIFHIRLYNTSGQLLTGSELKGAILVDQNVQTLELSYRQLIAAQVIESLSAGAVEDRFLAQHLDLTALQTQIEAMMQISGTFPNYAFVHHPSLIDVPALVAALRANQGNIAAIDATDPGYLLTPGSLQLSLNGVLTGQPLNLSLDDALSANLQANADGQVMLNQLPPGTWQLRIEGPGYLPQTLSVTIPAGGQIDLGTAIVAPPTPVLNALSPAAGVPGSSVTLTGSGFNPTLSNNSVRFGSTPATVTAATATGLTVTVPGGLPLGSVPVTVRVGQSANSGSQTYSVVKPMLTNLSPNAASAGMPLTLAGAYFSATPADNTVTVGGISAAVTAASTTELTVTLPAGLSGTVPVVVKNGASEPSDPLNLVIRPTLGAITPSSGSWNQPILLSGSGFSATPASNAVSFGGVNAPVDAASNTSLSVRVPTGVIAGSRSLVVSVGGQASAGQNFIVLPQMTSLTSSQSLSGQAVLIRGELLTIAGQHFDPQITNNSVNFGELAAVPASVNAGGTQLTVVVPADVDIPGAVSLSVTTNGQTSNVLGAVVPGINITVNGGFK